MDKNFVKRAVHLDFHTMPGIYDVGRDFDAEEFASTLKKARVDYITVFARCNLGFAYYPTRVGIVHPGMKVKDMLGGMVDSCHKEGIKVAAYFNAGLDHEHAFRHREWCKVNKDGLVYDINAGGSFFRRMCFNTGYKDHLLSMIEEVLNKYPVDGIFLDCLGNVPCYGGECLDAMKKLGIDTTDEKEVTRFNWSVTEKFMEETNRLVRSKNKKAYILYNGGIHRKQPTHIELEILPQGGWGYDLLPFVIRYVRTLKKPYLTMTGRFHKSWGDFGGLRSEASLLFDCYNSVANGGSCSIGDHMHPRGRLDSEVYNLIGKVYSKIEKLEKYVEDAKPVTEILVIDPSLAMRPALRSDTSGLSGAARMLLELKYQFDVSDGLMDISRYKVIILPDNVFLDKSLKKKLEQHLAKGGVLITSAFSGLDAGKKDVFALKEYKISFAGKEENDPSFFVANREIADGLPGRPVTIYQPGVAIKARKGAKVLCRLYKPYFNAGYWDMRHWHRYAPPEKDTGRPALVQCGNIFHFSFPVFSGYFRDAVVDYKTLLGNCIGRAFPSPLVRCENLPSFAQVTLMQRGKSRIVQVLSYVPEMRGAATQIIEEPICLKDVRVGLRKDGRKPAKAYLAPSGKSLEIEDGGQYTWTEIPEVKGYQMVVFE